MRMTEKEIQLITYNTNGLIQGNVYEWISIYQNQKKSCPLIAHVFHDHILFTCHQQLPCEHSTGNILQHSI